VYRAYAQPKIEALRMRNVQLKIGARPSDAGESTATVTMTRHLYPFGAAVTGPELDNKAFQEFFLQNFNGVTDEVFSKWHVSDSPSKFFKYLHLITYVYCNGILIRDR
jgi:hypothetical protein